MTITWKEKEIPIKISYYAIKNFQEETKETIGKIDENHIHLLEVLVWYGIIAGYKSEGRELDIKREDVEWILDDSLTQIYGAISNQLPGSTNKTKKK